MVRIILRNGLTVEMSVEEFNEWQKQNDCVNERVYNNNLASLGFKEVKDVVEKTFAEKKKDIIKELVVDKPHPIHRELKWWTKQEVNELKDYCDQGLSTKKISKLMGRSKKSIELRKHKEGFNKKKVEYTRKLRPNNNNWSGKSWTIEEISTLKRLLDAPTIEIMSHYPNRTYSAVMNKRRELGGDKRAPGRGKKVKGVNSNGMPDLRSTRGKFVFNKANYYQRTYNWSREKAMIQASNDWVTHSSLGISSNLGTVTPLIKEIKIDAFTLKTFGKEELYVCNKCGALAKTEYLNENFTLSKIFCPNCGVEESK